MKNARLGEKYRLPEWICERINILIPFGDGPMDTAIYDGQKITLKVPATGFRRDANALSEWMAIGPTGRILKPQKLRF